MMTENFWKLVFSIDVALSKHADTLLSWIWMLSFWKDSLIIRTFLQIKFKTSLLFDPPEGVEVMDPKGTDVAMAFSLESFAGKV